MAQKQDSIAERVFGIVELAEAILLNLPPRQVLVGQRVCRMWRGVVQGSKQLKQALLLIPVGDKRVSHHGAATGGIWAESARETKPTTVFENPLLSMRGAWSSINEAAVHYPEASWRHMLVAHPPLKEIRFCYYAPHLGCYGRNWHGPGTATIQRHKGGLTMAEVEGYCGEEGPILNCWVIKGELLWKPLAWSYRSANEILDMMEKASSG